MLSVLAAQVRSTFAGPAAVAVEFCGGVGGVISEVAPWQAVVPESVKV